MVTREETVRRGTTNFRGMQSIFLEPVEGKQFRTVAAHWSLGVISVQCNASKLSRVARDKVIVWSGPNSLTGWKKLWSACAWSEVAPPCFDGVLAGCCWWWQPQNGPCKEMNVRSCKYPSKVHPVVRVQPCLALLLVHEDGEILFAFSSSVTLLCNEM